MCVCGNNSSEGSKMENNTSVCEKSIDQSYKDYFYNLVKSRSMNNNMAIKQLMEPANPFGIENDHTYCKLNMEKNLLVSLKLLDVPSEDIVQIEGDTFLQNKNEYWHECRKIRITPVSFMHAIKI